MIPLQPNVSLLGENHCIFMVADHIFDLVECIVSRHSHATSPSEISLPLTIVFIEKSLPEMSLKKGRIHGCRNN